jgi:hypothetical protein
MKFIKITKLFPLLSFLLLLATTDTVAQTEEDKKLSIIEKRMEATVCIGIVQELPSRNTSKAQKSFIPIGTGVIIEIPDDPQKRVCLVTAKHVFEDPSKNWYPNIISLRFTWHQHLALDEYHGIKVRIRDEKNKFWLEHSEADLASIPLFINTDLLGKETVSAVTMSQLLEPKDLSVGQPVIVLGFPGAVRVSLGSSFLTLPLARRGIISWLPSSAQMPRAMLIDTMAFPGNSGGPVFNEPRVWDKYGEKINKPQPTAFIGIVSKAAIQPVDIKAVKVSDESQKGIKPLSLDYMGLTQIEPADRVKELLEIVRKKISKRTEPAHGQ